MKIAKTGTKRRTPARRRSDEPVGGAAIRYIETSALLAAVLDDDASALEAIRGEGLRICSLLTFVEASRVVMRERVAERFTEGEARAALRRLRSFKDRCDLLDLTDEVFERVGRRFPVEPVRTLDAIHLASAELIDEQPQLVTIVTRDRRIRENALALGFTVE